MTVYLTKVWGFDTPAGPLVFSMKQFRTHAVNVLQPGDTVILVGTFGDNTADADQGVILGMLEPTKDAVSSLDYYPSPQHGAPLDFDEAGKFRWPFGLTVRRAWRFLEPRTRLKAISDRHFRRDAAAGIVPLTNEEAALVAALPKEECGLRAPFRAAARVMGEEEARRRGALPPTTTRRGIMHLRHAPASTYCLEVIRPGPVQSAYKIGWAFDAEARRRQFNLYSLPDLGGLHYKLHMIERWDTATEAFRIEQTILRQFDQHRFRGNREVLSSVTKDDLIQAWQRYVHKSRRGC